MTLRLFLLNPSTVFAAQVNQASFSYPLAELTFDGVTTGAYTDIQPGMTVLFGSAAGEDDYGRQRIRKAATSDTLYIGRSSRGIRDGEVDLADDCYVTALDDFRVWSKIPYAEVSADDPPQTTWYKDHDLAVGTNTTNPPPVANCGPGAMATIDSTSSVITVNFDGTNSFAMAGSISSYLWDVDDGTITVGTAASSSITATFPAGFRWVSLTVTDSNGNSHTARCPVFARDPNDDACIDAFEITSHRITAQGQTLSVRIRQAIDSGTYPDGTLAMIGDGEPADGDDRSNMLFIGWHQSDPASIAGTRTATLRDTTLNLVDVAGRLKELPAFSQEVTTAATPADWDEMTSPNHDKYVHYLLNWHSTALDVADYSDTGTGSAFAMVDFASPPGDVFGQVNERCNALEPDYHFTCNTLGQLRQIIDPMLQDSGDRTSTVQASLTEDDWSSLSYTHQRPPTVAMIQHEEAVLVSSSEVDVAFADAPGSSPGQGAVIQSHGNQLTPSQAVLNAVVGHRYARLNAVESHFVVTLAEGDDQDIEPADMTWVQLTLGTAYAAQRSFTLSAERGLAHEINIRYDHRREGLVRTVELEWERETSGTPGVTYTPEVDTGYTAPDDLWTGNWTGNRPTAVADIWAGSPAAYILYDVDEILLTMDVLAASPTWTNITGSIAGVEILDVQYVAHTNNTMVGLWALTVAGVYWCNDVFASPPVWTQKLSLATVQATEVAPDNGASEFAAMVNHGYRPGALHVFTQPNSESLNYQWLHGYSWSTTDFGSNWTLCDSATEITDNDIYERGYQYLTFQSAEWYRDAGTNGKGRIYARRQSALYGGSNQDGRIVYSDDDGATWVKGASITYGTNEFNVSGLRHPFPNTTDPLLVVAGYVGASKLPDLYVSTDNGDTVGSPITPSGYEGFAWGWRPNQKYNTPQHILAWARAAADKYFDLIESNDAGSSWSLVYDAPSSWGNSLAPNYSMPNGWPSDSNVWFLIRSNTNTSFVLPTIYSTSDYFATLDDRSGNAATAHGGAWDPTATGIDGYIPSGFALPKIAPNV